MSGSPAGTARSDPLSLVTVSPLMEVSQSRRSTVHSLEFGKERKTLFYSRLIMAKQYSQLSLTVRLKEVSGLLRVELTSHQCSEIIRLNLGTMNTRLFKGC